MGELIETGFRAARGPLWREALGAFLRHERGEQRRILADVATEAGVSTQYLSEIERGLKEPSSEVLAAVADALGLTLVDVTLGVGAMLEAERAAVARRMLVLRSSTGPMAPASVSPAPSFGSRDVMLAA